RSAEANLAVFAVSDAWDLCPGPPLGNVSADVVELADGYPIDRGGSAQRFHRLNGDVSADHANFEAGILFFQPRSKKRVARERGRAGMENGQLIVASERSDLFDGQAIGGRIDELAAGNHCGRLRQPGGIPEGADFATSLIARSCAAIESLIAR